MIDWQDLHHSDLSVSQLYALLQLICSGTKLSLPGYRW